MGMIRALEDHIFNSMSVINKTFHITIKRLKTLLAGVNWYGHKVNITFYEFSFTKVRSTSPYPIAGFRKVAAFILKIVKSSIN